MYKHLNINKKQICTTSHVMFCRSVRFCSSLLVDVNMFSVLINLSFGHLKLTTDYMEVKLLKRSLIAHSKKAEKVSCACWLPCIGLRCKKRDKAVLSITVRKTFSSWLIFTAGSLHPGFFVIWRVSFKFKCFQFKSHFWQRVKCNIYI